MACLQGFSGTSLAQGRNGSDLSVECNLASVLELPPSAHGEKEGKMPFYGDTGESSIAPNYTFDEVIAAIRIAQPT